LPNHYDIERLRLDYNFRCGYCGVHEEDVGGLLEIDHFQPTSRGGLDEYTNWVYCCTTCNRIKSDFWPKHNPLTTTYRILHPKRDNLSQHIREEPDGRLIAVTETGQFHLTRLRLNRPQLIARRRKQKELVIFRVQQRQMLMRLEELEQQLEQLLYLTAQYIAGNTDARTLLEALLASRMPPQD
jgi:hypothetical protein